LFGQIAKAKASEIPVAGAVYTRLQDAFLGEKASVGSWKQIGFYVNRNSCSCGYCRGISGGFFT
jgi:hypothetical protein